MATSAVALRLNAPTPEPTAATIERSPFAFVATRGADGTCDVSPRGAHPGFVRVLDDRLLRRRVPRQQAR